MLYQLSGTSFDIAHRMKNVQAGVGASSIGSPVQLPTYPMEPGRKRGLALILNVDTYQAGAQHSTGAVMRSREGSLRDVEVIVDLFRWLKFDVVHEEDCQEDLYETVKRYLRGRDFSYDDCFACVLMSHSSEGCLYSATGMKNELHSIFHLPFDVSVCPGLATRAVPKLFFVQACQTAVVQSGDYAQPKLEGIPQRDFLYSHATRQGNTAYPQINLDTSSVYVNCLDECLRRYVPLRLDLSSILTEVSKRVAEELRSANLLAQSCSHVNELTKRLIFPEFG